MNVSSSAAFTELIFVLGHLSWSRPCPVSSPVLQFAGELFTSDLSSTSQSGLLTYAPMCCHVAACLIQCLAAMLDPPGDGGGADEALQVSVQVSEFIHLLFKNPHSIHERQQLSQKHVKNWEWHQRQRKDEVWDINDLINQGLIDQDWLIWTGCCHGNTKPVRWFEKCTLRIRAVTSPETAWNVSVNVHILSTRWRILLQCL